MRTCVHAMRACMRARARVRACVRAMRVCVPCVRVCVCAMRVCVRAMPVCHAYVRARVILHEHLKWQVLRLSRATKLDEATQLAHVHTDLLSA